MSLILSAIIVTNCQFFHPTIDGARYSLPYIEAEVPYVLGISVPPPDLTFVEIIQGNTVYYSDYCQGTFTITTITDELPVQFYDGTGNYLGQIVPEPVTIITMLIGTLCLRRLR
jgi:hypothetical protein